MFPSRRQVVRRGAVREDVMLQPSRFAVSSSIVRKPTVAGVPAFAFTWISRKSPGVPTPPRPEVLGRAEPVVAGGDRDVLRQHVGRGRVGAADAVVVLGVEHRGRRVERDVAERCIAGPELIREPGGDRRDVARRAGVQLPVDSIRPTRRSPFASASRIAPFVFRSMRPLLSVLPEHQRRPGGVGEGRVVGGRGT